MLKLTPLTMRRSFCFLSYALQSVAYEQLQLIGLGLLETIDAFPLSIGEHFALNGVENQVLIPRGEVQEDLRVFGKGETRFLLADLSLGQPGNKLRLDDRHTCSMNSRSSW